MNPAVPLLALAVMAAGAGIAHAEVPSPYQQFREGVPADQIVCAGDRVLMESPSGTPACVFAGSAGELAGRGFEQVVRTAEAPSSHGAEPPWPGPIPPAVAHANNAFALDFYGQIADMEGNHFFSPASMYAAFSVLYEGARGETAEQIRDVFGMAEDNAARHLAVSDTMSSLNRDDPHATLEMANSLWLAERLVPHAKYVETVRGTYQADIETVDFTDYGEGGAVDLINGWASEKTREKIPEVLKPGDVDDSTLAAILNAIYFKGAWEVPFDPEDTRPRGFDTGNGTVEVDTMHVEASFAYAEYDGVQILRMPYVGDRLSMLVALPSGPSGMESLEGSLSTGTLEGWRQNMQYEGVLMSIPKFEIKTHYDLIPKLEDLGVTLIFNATGNLSGISDTPMFVDRATQDAYVNVNEEGTEAAAVTTIIIIESGSATFNADRPFLFFIIDDESGAILFMGKITDPSA